MAYKPGDIVLVNYNPTKGKEIGKIRPSIVISKEEDNEILQTIVVIPLSTVVKPDTFPYRVFISRREKLKYDSDACIYEIRALSKTKVKEKLGKLHQKELETIQNALCKIFTKDKQ